MKKWYLKTFWGENTYAIPFWLKKLVGVIVLRRKVRKVVYIGVAYHQKIQWQKTYGVRNPRGKNKAYKARHWRRGRNFCNKCKIKLKFRDGIVDHKVPLMFGGSREFKNTQILCITCSRKKDAREREQRNRQREQDEQNRIEIETRRKALERVKRRNTIRRYLFGKELLNTYDWVLATAKRVTHRLKGQNKKEKA